MFFQVKTFDRVVEAVCDSWASVSCPSNENFKSLKSKLLRLELTLKQVKGANHLPSETRGVIRLPVSSGWRNFKHNSQVLANWESDCLTILDFLKYQLFWKKKLRLNDNTFVPVYRRMFCNPNSSGLLSCLRWHCLDSSRFFHEHTGPHPRMKSPNNKVGHRVRAARMVAGWKWGHCLPWIVEFRWRNKRHLKPKTTLTLWCLD